jgi:hypothetical protein
VARVLGRDVPVVSADDGTLRADDNGKPGSARSVQSYITRTFDDRPGEAREAMEALAASLPPEEPNRLGFRLYVWGRADVPVGAEGWKPRENCGLSGYIRRVANERCRLRCRAACRHKID